ncbi:uncharacterized protein [Watersipora subatra]|uniref:uncharacterized protein n=1 Tax=Watersipora subatra TaxID=2589382 RepID=UPI00355C511C
MVRRSIHGRFSSASTISGRRRTHRMMSLKIVVQCILWAGSVAAPLRGYNQNSELYQMRRVNPYQFQSEWTEQPANQIPISRAYGYHFQVQPSRLEEPYNTVDNNYDAWKDESIIWPEEVLGYDVPDDVVGNQKLRNMMQTWQEQQLAKEDGNIYPANPKMVYIQVTSQVNDDNLWKREQIDSDTFKDMLEAIPQYNPGENGEMIQSQRDSDGMDLFQRIAMRLVNTADEANKIEAVHHRALEGENYSPIDDSVEIREKDPKLSQETAESLLQQLKAVDEEQEASDEMVPAKENVDKAELEDIFEASKEVVDNQSADMPKDADGETTKSKDQIDVGGTLSNEELKKAERELLKEENRLLIEVIHRAPLELIRAPSTIEQVKALIGNAASRQEAVDYIERRLEVQ